MPRRFSVFIVLHQDFACYLNCCLSNLKHFPSFGHLVFHFSDDLFLWFGTSMVVTFLIHLKSCSKLLYRATHTVTFPWLPLLCGIKIKTTSIYCQGSSGLISALALISLPVSKGSCSVWCMVQPLTVFLKEIYLGTFPPAAAPYFGGTSCK